MAIEISTAGLPAEIEQALDDLHIRTLESLYCRLNGSPDLWKAFLSTYKVDYDQLLSRLRDIIPSDILRRLDTPVRDQMPTGALDTDDDERIQEWIETGRSYLLTRRLLNDLAAKGLIEKGNYVISVCW